MIRKALFLPFLLMAALGHGAVTSIVTLPGGSNGDIQFNSQGRFGASSSIVYSTVTGILTVGGISVSSMTVGGPPIFDAHFYGAIGDGVTNDYVAVSSALNAAATAGGGLVLLHPGKSYYMTTAPVVPDHVTFDLMGSTLAMTLGSGNTPGLRLKNFSTIRHGAIDVTSTGTPGSQPFWHACISIGEANDLDPNGNSVYQHVHDWIVEDLALRTSRANTPVIQGMGDIYNGTIRNIYIPDSTTSNGIFFDSGNVGVSSSLSPDSARMFENQYNFNLGTYWTTHPHDIKIENVTAGNLTTPFSAPDVGSRAIRLSGVYNFLISNVIIASSTYAAFDVTAGDLGFEFALTSDLRFGMQGIKFVNCRSQYGREAAELDTFADNVNNAVVTSTYAARTSTIMQGDLQFDNFIAVGLGSTQTLMGDAIRIEQSNGIHFRGGAISLYLYGVDMDTASVNDTFEGMQVYRNSRAGFYIVSGRNSHDISIKGNYVWGNGTDTQYSTTQAGIDVAGGKRVSVEGNLVGADNEDTQYYAVRVESGGDAANVSVKNNNVRGVKTAGTAYLMGDSSTAYSILSVYDNNIVTGSTQTWYGGVNVVPFTGGAETSSTAPRLFRSSSTALTSGTPTAGTWTAGDTIFYMDYSSGGRVGSACTVSGSPGTWVQFGTVGTTPVSTGGTGATTLTAHGALLGEGTSAITALPAMANGGLMIGAGTGSDPSTGTLTSTSNQTSVTNGAGSITLGLAGPHNFTTQTTHGLLLGQGTSAVTATPAMANGGLVIGAGTSSDPSTGTLTGTSNQITVTNGAGSITLSTPQNIATTSSPQFSLVTTTSTSPNFVSLYSGAASSGVKGAFVGEHNRNSDNTVEQLMRMEVVAEDNQSTGGFQFIARNGSDVSVMRGWSTGRVEIGSTSTSPSCTLDVVAGGQIGLPVASSIRGTITPGKAGALVYDSVANSVCMSTGTTSTSWISGVTGTTVCAH